MPEWTLEQLVVAVLVITAFIILMIILVGLKLGIGASIWYSGCTGKIGGDWNSIARGYENPRCITHKSNESCITAYPPFKIEDHEIKVCLWSREANLCVLNSAITCEDLSQKTIPKCQELPDCRPINVIQEAVNRLMKTTK